MRAHVPSYELVQGKTLNDVLSLLAREPSVWRPFAGGTDLMVVYEAGKLTHRKFVNVWGLPELQGVSATQDSITLGALTTFSQVQENQILRSEFPMLCQAAAETGAIAIQNRGTIGGNIVNASPAADSPPALMAYDAEVELVSANGSRWVKYDGFHTGYKSTVMRPDELLKSVRLPRKARGAVQFYRKVGTRKAQAISKVCFAGLARVADGKLADARLVFGSVAPTALRARKTEAALSGAKLGPALVAKARQALATELAPIDDIRSTREYRLNVGLNLLEEFLKYVELDH